MKNINRLLIVAVVGFGLTCAGTASAFSFGDSNWRNPYWGNPYWGAPVYGAPARGGPVYGAPVYGAPVYGVPAWGVPYYRRPYLRSYDRHVMRSRRQSAMEDHNEAMNDLADMLYGNYRFDRAEAIKLAREIEAGSGETMLRNFHPGAIATSGSRTMPVFFGNEETFRANALALKGAANALAEELEKTPEEKSAVYPSGGRRWADEEADAVSPEVWKRFNALSDSCQACHRSFRGPRW